MIFALTGLMVYLLVDMLFENLSWADVEGCPEQDDRVVVITGAKGDST